MIRDELAELIGAEATDLLITVYGEPEIEGRTKGWLWTVLPPTHRRLVFPWQAVD